ncbi:hypothetical protein AX768_31515 (plasmid) [Burkholderia sp. PAMC 28687]|nr:hypothetical protein AX768_31515 [Burkholderia sp. PAMC 28687]
MVTSVANRYRRDSESGAEQHQYCTEIRSSAREIVRNMQILMAKDGKLAGRAARGLATRSAEMTKYVHNTPAEKAAIQRG